MAAIPHIGALSHGYDGADGAAPSPGGGIFSHGHGGGEGSRRPTKTVACVSLVATVIRTEPSVPLSEEDYSFVVPCFRGDDLDR
jgi:hypothetical protein